jgi:hypothetical protein
MSEEVTFEPFYGQLTAETIRQMLQARFAQDYFQIAHALAPEAFMRHAALSSAIASTRERERNGS